MYGVFAYIKEATSFLSQINYNNIPTIDYKYGCIVTCSNKGIQLRFKYEQTVIYVIRNVFFISMNN